MSVKIVAGSDHAGLTLRAEAVRVARDKGFEVEDLGARRRRASTTRTTRRGWRTAVAAGRARLGVLVCGTGIGMSIAANKVKGIRAAHCHTEYEARMARAHNDANVLCIGERVIGHRAGRRRGRGLPDAAFEGGRHQRRVDKITALDR